MHTHRCSFFWFKYQLNYDFMLSVTCVAREKSAGAGEGPVQDDPQH